MATGKSLTRQKLKAMVMRVLDENRTMAVATVRPDGWPQATIVGFVHEELTLYFVVSRESQKLANLKRDPRVSIALGRAGTRGESIRGLSLAAHVDEVADPDTIQRLNDLVQDRYPQVTVFAPRTSNCAVLRAKPFLISLIDEAEGLAHPVLLKASTPTVLTVEG